MNYDDLCPQCEGALWKPHKDFPEIMLRFVHLHEGKKVTEILKFLPCDWSLSEKEAKTRGHLTPQQEWAIERILEEKRTPENPEGSNGALLADDMGVGKSGQAAEVILRGGFKRVLFASLPDTHRDLRNRVYAQSEGTVLPRVMNGTKEGRENFAEFLRGEDGVYIGGTHFLVAQDFESRPEWILHPDGSRTPEWVLDSKTGRPKLKERKPAAWATTAFTLDTADAPVAVETVKQSGMIGPAEEPIWKRKSHHLATFKKAGMRNHPLDLVVLDEMQVIANKKSQARRTLLSMSKESFKLGMSGTWFLNDPNNMWSGTRWIWNGIDPITGEPYIETNHGIWRGRYMAQVPVLNAKGEPLMRENHLGQKEAVLETAGEREPGAFIATLPCYIRREADDPIPKPIELYVDPTFEQEQQMLELKKDLMTWVWTHEGDEEPLVVNMPPELHARMRQVCIAELSLEADGSVGMKADGGFAKGAPLRYLLEQRWAGQPVAIYTDSKVGAHFMAQRLQAAGVDARAWTGDLSRGAREKLKQAFIAGEFRVLISTIQSFGVGIDGLQKVCDKVAWISDVEGSPAFNDQAIRRYLRPGRIMRNGRDEFEHARILMNDSVDVTGFQKLIGQAWNMRASMTLAA